jgi:hypothetical protein
LTENVAAENAANTSRQFLERTFNGSHSEAIQAHIADNSTLKDGNSYHYQDQK